MNTSMLPAGNSPYVETRPTSMTVGDPNYSYRNAYGNWQRCRAIVRGQSAARNHDSHPDVNKNLLLPFSPRMAPEHYEFFKKEGELPGLVSSYAKVLTGGLLRKQPQYTLPESLPADAKDWLEKDFGGESTSFVSFLSSAILEELTTSRCWVLVDFPSISAEAWDAMTDAERNSHRPYCVVLPAEQVINWRTRGKKLVKVTTRAYEENWADGAHHPSYEDVVTDYYLDNTGGLCVQRYTRETIELAAVGPGGSLQRAEGGSSDRRDWKPAGAVLLPTMHGKRLDRIPLFPLSGSVGVEEPILQVLIDREIGLYNKLSRRNHLLYGAATYTPYIAADMSDDQFTQIVNSGLGTWIHVEKGGTVGALETPTDALADMEKSIAATVEEMARMGIRMLAPEGGANTSGVSLEIRNAAQTAQLGLLAGKINQTLESVLALMLEWAYGDAVSPGSLEFALSQDFNPTPLGADWLKLVTEWYQAGLIPRTLWLSICRTNDIIPAEYDDLEGQQEISADPVVVAARAASLVDVNQLDNTGSTRGGKPNPGGKPANSADKSAKPEDQSAGKGALK